MNCKWSEKIHALYDGALDASEQAKAEAHAAACADCARELAALRAVGRFMHAGAPKLPSIDALAPLYARIKAGRNARLHEPRVIRMAKWLTSAAALVIVGCGVALISQPVQPKSTELAAQNWTSLALGADYDETSSAPSSDDPFAPMPEYDRDSVHE